MTEENLLHQLAKSTFKEVRKDINAAFEEYNMLSQNVPVQVYIDICIKHHWTLDEYSNENDKLMEYLKELESRIKDV